MKSATTKAAVRMWAMISSSMRFRVLYVIHADWIITCSQDADLKSLIVGGR